MVEADDELLAEWLLQWEELYERGQDTPASELAKARPDLIDALSQRIAVLKSAQWLDRGDDGDDPPPPEERGPRSDAPPKLLAGRYRLDELIAEGGFAQVFRAYDRDLQRTVALKLPKASRLESTDAFLAEREELPASNIPVLCRFMTSALRTTCALSSASMWRAGRWLTASPIPSPHAIWLFVGFQISLMLSNTPTSMA